VVVVEVVQCQNHRQDQVALVVAEPAVEVQIQARQARPILVVVEAAVPQK
jgi:hypothetical protein